MKTGLLLTAVLLLGGGVGAAPGDEWRTAWAEVRPRLEQAVQSAANQPQAAHRPLQQALAALRRARERSAQGPFASAAQEVEETLQQALKAQDGREKEALIRQAQGQVASLEAVSRWLEGRADPQGRAKATLKEILASREFQRRGEDAFSRWLRKVLQWLLRLLERLFPALQGGGRAARVAMWIIGFLLFAVLVFLVAYGLTAWLRSLGIRSARPQEAQDGGRVVRPGERPTPEALLAQAEQRAGTGDYREALRWLYQAVLLLLDRRQLVEFDETRTNWEYQRALGAQPDPWWPDRFAWATDLFEAKWYGGQAAQEPDYRSFLDYYREAAGRPEP